VDLPRLPAIEFRRRWSAVQEEMAVRGLDLVIAFGDDHAVFGPAHVRYLSNFPVHFEPACVLLGPEGDAVLATGAETVIHAELVASTTRCLAVEELGVPGEEYPYLELVPLADAIADVATSPLARVGIAGLDQTAVDVWERVRPALGSTKLERVDDFLLALRRRKSPAELDVLRYAFTLTAAAVEAARAACRAGAYEFEVAAAAEHALRSRGAEGTAIDTIVASGTDNSRPIIGRTGSRQLRAGEPISLTLAPRYEGYGAPIGRLVHIGALEEPLARAAAVALEAQDRAIAALRPGVRCCDVDAAARDYLGEVGYERHAAYGVAHSVGVQEFEPPFFGPGNVELVEPDMVVSVDIPMFFGAWGGFRLEDAFVVAEDGAHPLTNVERGPLVLTG
jgi:Xaa-Pro aminopeptidase